MASKAHLDANQRYLDKKEEIRVWVEKGKRAEVRQYAMSDGYDSLNAYVKHLIRQDSGIEL